MLIDDFGTLYLTVNSFDLFIIEECSENILTEKEQKWIDHYKSIGCVYNAANIAINSYFTGKYHTEEAKEKMSAFMKGKYCGSNNPNFGNKYSKETLIKISEGLSDKLNTEKVLQIVKLLKEDKLSHKEIAKQFDILRTVVTRISNGTRWTSVTGGAVIPVVYDENGKRQFTESHKKRAGDSKRGFKHSEESKDKMRKKRIGTKHSKESKANMSAAQQRIKMNKNKEKGVL